MSGAPAAKKAPAPHPGHAMIVGVTGSGKTVMARQLARSYAARGIASIVLDKFDDDWGPRALVTRDYSQFLAWAKASERCALFIDEAAEVTSRSKEHDAMEAVATQARHLDHVAHFITPGAMSIRKEIRSHLLRRFIFRQEESDARGLYREKGKRIYLATAELPAGVFLYAAQLPPFPAPKLCRVPGWKEH